MIFWPLVGLLFGLGSVGNAVADTDSLKRVIPVTEAGIFAERGAIYRLMNDITSTHSAVFLGNNVTLDLNGYTITYAKGDYEQIRNGGFEQGVIGWDMTKAPGAKVVSTKEVHAFVGDSLLSMLPDDEVVSSYVNLAYPNRSYYAMCGITGRYDKDRKTLEDNMIISVYVEDEAGELVYCQTSYMDTVVTSVPVERKTPRLGGGFVVAHLNGLPAGKYRVRIKADTDCLIDEVDIRPAFDVGIGIVGEAVPNGHNDHLFEGKYTAFFDYADDVRRTRPRKGTPQVKGGGTIVIKNGKIKNGTPGVMSWGVQSTAEDIKLVLENLEIESEGINSIAVDVPQATISKCVFRTNNPYIINRHGSQFHAVDLRGEKPSEVSYSSFFGGQGCLVLKGKGSSVYRNIFANRQTVTNHYSIAASGDSLRIYENRFEPEIGSGINVFRRQGVEIFDNYFKVSVAPPSCEYHLDYSTNGVRLADYGAVRGSEKGARFNKIYNNTFEIAAHRFDEYPDYVGMANAIFFSASAGDNEVYGNQVSVWHEDPEAKTIAHAFYIGNADGGMFERNTVVSNVTPIWVACPYGSAADIDLTMNTLVKHKDADLDFPAIRLGYKGARNPALNIAFRSNTLIGMPFTVEQVGEAEKDYLIRWTLDAKFVGTTGTGVSGVPVSVLDRQGSEVYRGASSVGGGLKVELTQTEVSGGVVVSNEPYKLVYPGGEQLIHLTENVKLKIEVKQ
ncbi:hypothetical protein [Sphingobacterium pedocola]|nr:hypothetical protein [Sphingobacterium pedocola]